MRGGEPEVSADSPALRAFRCTRGDAEARVLGRMIRTGRTP